MASFSRVGAHLGLAAASTLLTLLAAEGVLRLAGYAPASFQHTNRIANRGRTRPPGLLSQQPARLLRRRPPRPGDAREIPRPGTGAPRRGRPPHPVRGRAPLQHAAVPVARDRAASAGRGARGRHRRLLHGRHGGQGRGHVRARAPSPAQHAARRPGTGRSSTAAAAATTFPAIHDLFETVLALEPDVVIYGMVLNDAVALGGLPGAPGLPQRLDPRPRAHGPRRRRPPAAARWTSASPRSCATGSSPTASDATPRAGTATCTAPRTARVGSARRPTCAT